MNSFASWILILSLAGMLYLLLDKFSD